MEETNSFNNELKFTIARLTENKNFSDGINKILEQDLSKISNENNILQEFKYHERRKLSVLRAEVNSLGLEESRINEQLLGLRDANELLLAKANDLDSENNSLKESIDLMRIDLQTMNTNEQSLVAKVRQIDSENVRLVDESQNLKQKRLISLKGNLDN